MKQSNRLKDYSISVLLIILCLWSVSNIFTVGSGGHVVDVDSVLAENAHRSLGSIALIENKSEAQKPIILFVTSWCGACHSLEKRMSDSGLVFKKVDIEKNQEGLNYYLSSMQSRSTPVPVTLVGNKLFVGTGDLQAIISESKTT